MTSYPSTGDRPEGIGASAGDPGLEALPEASRAGEAVPSSTPRYGGGYGAETSDPFERSDVTTTGQAGSKSEQAKSEAADVKDTALDAGSNVASTAKQEASNVVREASTQARSLLDQLRSDVREQGGGQKDKLASTLHSLSKELGSMASKSDEDGPATDLVRQASRRGGEIAHWLDNHEVGDALEEIKRYGRRHPVAFLAICAGAGVLVGRLTRGAVAANTSLDSADSSATGRALPSGSAYSTPAAVSPEPYAGPSGTSVPAADPYAPGAPPSAQGWPPDTGAGSGSTGGVVSDEARGGVPGSTGVLNGPGDGYDGADTGPGGDLSAPSRSEYRP